MKHKIEILIANVFQESKMFHQIVVFIRNFAYNTHETYLFDTSCYFVINQQFLCYYCSTLTSLMTSQAQVKKWANVYAFLRGSFAVMEPSGNTGFFQWVQKVTSVGCNWLISIHVVCFDYDWQLTFFLNFSCNLIG